MRSDTHRFCCKTWWLGRAAHLRLVYRDKQDAVNLIDPVHLSPFDIRHIHRETWVRSPAAERPFNSSILPSASNKRHTWPWRHRGRQTIFSPLWSQQNYNWSSAQHVCTCLRGARRCWANGSAPGHGWQPAVIISKAGFPALTRAD